MAFSMSLGNLIVRIVGDNSNLAKSLRGTEMLLNQTATKAKQVGKTLTRNITVPLTLVGGASLKAFENFDSGMTQSLAIMKSVSPQMRKEMEMTAKVLSSTGRQSASELAESYFFLASAGLSAEQSIASLSTVQSFATAGMFDMSKATDLLTDAQSALGMTTKDTQKNMENMTKLSDVLVTANTLANASVEQFSTALTSKAATAMKSYNIDLEEGVAVLAAYADQGIKAELAGNTFARMLRLLIKNVNENGQEFEKLGVATKDAAGNLMPIADIMEGINKATSSMGSTQKAAQLTLLGFEARAQDAILPLLGMSDAIRGYEDNLQKAGGTTQRISDAQLKSFGSQMKILWNNVKLAGIEIGETLSPAVIWLGKKLKIVLDWFQKLTPNQKKWLVLIGATAAAMGPLLIGLGSFLFLMNASIGLLAGFSPIILIIGAVALAVWGIVDAATGADLGFIKLLKSFKIGSKDLLTWMKIMAEGFWLTWDWALAKVNIAFEFWMTFLGDVWNRIEQGAIWSVKQVVSLFWGMSKTITGIFKTLITKVTKGLRVMRVIDGEERGKMVQAAWEMTDRVNDAATTANGYYENALKDSLNKSKGLWDNYHKYANNKNADIAKKQKSLAEQIAKTAEKNVLPTSNIQDNWGVPKNGIDFTQSERDWGKDMSQFGPSNNIMEEQLTGYEEFLAGRNKLQEQYGTGSLLLQGEHEKALIAQQTINAEEQLQIQKQRNTAMIDGTASLFGMMAAVAEAGGNKNFKIWQAFSMAEAIVSTYSAATKALAAPPGPPYTIPMAASVVGMGLLRVRQIAMTRPGSSSGSGSTGSITPSTTPTDIQKDLGIDDNEENTRQNVTNIILEKVYGTVDNDFVDKLADSFRDRVGDGQDYGLVSVTQ